MFDSFTIAVFVAGLVLGVIAALHAVYQTFRVGSFFATVAMLYTVVRVLRQMDHRTPSRAADVARQFVPAGR